MRWGLSKVVYQLKTDRSSAIGRGLKHRACLHRNRCRAFVHIQVQGNAYSGPKHSGKLCPLGVQLDGVQFLAEKLAHATGNVSPIVSLSCSLTPSLCPCLSDPPRCSHNPCNTLLHIKASWGPL